MAHLFKSVALFSLMVSLGLATIAYAADRSDSTDIAKRLDASADVLTQVMSDPDQTIPASVLAEAKCVAVIPSMFKVALGFGGRHGRGVVTCHTAQGWSAPGPISISGGSVGLQIGSQSVDIVLVILDQEAFKELLSHKFKIGADVAGSPGPVNGDTPTDPSWRDAKILTYSKSRGVFAGVDLKGAVVKQDKDAIVELYGRYVPIGSIVAGKVPPPRDSHEFLATLRKYIAEAQHS